MSTMRDVLRECVRQVINELRWDREMIDLFKEKIKKAKLFQGNPAIDALHVWLWEANLIKAEGDDVVLTDRLNAEEYEAMKLYAIARYRGLIRQYRRSKDPVQSALSALNFWIGNYYNSKIASGQVRRQLQRAGVKTP